MNLSGKHNSSLLFANFNQDYSGISVGTPDGFRIFSCDPFVNIFTQNDGGIGIAEMLFMTSLVAVVGAGDQPDRSPRRLQIINTKSRSIICEQNFVTAILSVKLNKKRMAVVMETKIHIYDISTMKILHTIDTFPNPKGVCAFSPCHKKSYLAYPASQSSGDVYLFDTLSLQTVSSVTAHKAGIVAMAISHDGLLLATASEKGTIIRVHELPNMSKSESFRRGTYPAGITSISFSRDERYLAAASDTGTVHIFKVSLQGVGQEGGSSSSSSGLSSAVMSIPMFANLASAYLPDVISQAWEPQRDVAHIKLPTLGIPALTGIVADPNSPSIKIIILTGDGFYYTYSLDPTSNQGELKLIQEHSLLMDATEPPPPPRVL